MATAFHTNDEGKTLPCSNTSNCPFTSYDSAEESAKAYESKMESNGAPLQGTSKKKNQKLVESHGQMVRKGQVGSSDFVKGFSIREGMNSYYDGSWEDLQSLVKKNFADNEPGTGSEGGDVLLINVPSENFYTSIVEVDESNKHLVEEVEYVRREGEAPVYMKVIRGIEKPPATDTQIVVYRADTLAKDGGERSTEDEWEIVSVNAQIERETPMHPTTMLRNSNNEEGGTQRNYTDKEWSDAHEYWKNHAYIETPETKR